MIAFEVVKLFFSLILIFCAIRSISSMIEEEGSFSERRADRAEQEVNR